jgi:hypothetical protein
MNVVTAKAARPSGAEFPQASVAETFSLAGFGVGSAYGSVDTSTVLISLLDHCSVCWRMIRFVATASSVDAGRAA